MVKYWPSGRPRGWSSKPRNFLQIGGPAARTIPVGVDYSKRVVSVDLPQTLNRNERGCVIFNGAPIESDASGFRVTSELVFDPDVVRGALLLFDRIDCPVNNCIQIGDSCPRGLEEWAGFQNTRVLYREASAEQSLFNATFRAALSALDEREEGLWSLARSSRGAPIPTELLSPIGGIILKLHHALPLPSREVPYDEVLTFKSRRIDELHALRHHIDQVAIDVVNQGIGGFAERAAFERFDKALADHIKVSREANFMKRVCSLDVSFSLSDVLRAGIATLAQNVVGLPLSSAVTTSVVAGLSVAIGPGKKQQTQQISPFEYIIKAGREM